MDAESSLTTTVTASINVPMASYLAGACAGASQIVVGFPADTVKVKLQGPLGSSFKGPMDCLHTILYDEGIRGLYKGMVAPLLIGSLSNAILFGTYDELTYKLSRKDGSISFTNFTLACVLTGIAESSFYAPMELIKVRLQVQKCSVGSSTYISPWRIITDIINTVGPFGMFRGMLPTLLRECPGNVIYFSSYETSKRVYSTVRRTCSDNERTLISGGIAGVAYWTCMLPIDNIKTKMQSDSLNHPRYSGLIDCFRQTKSEEGLLHLFRGLTPVALRAFPANAVGFGTFELMNRNFKLLMGT